MWHHHVRDWAQQVTRLVITFTIGAALGGTAWYVLKKGEPQPDTSSQQEATVAETPVATSEPETEAESAKPEELPIFETTELQATLDQWNAEQTGTASVSVLNTQGELLASVNKDRSFFAASIYKLYVAYFGYRQVDAGAVDPSEIYLGNYTRAKCLDLMIRESHSPCAEKLWTEIGKEKQTEDLKALGINNTTMTNIQTTSYDAGLMMARFARGEGLSAASQAAFLASAKDQIYRDALNKGFSSNVTVYNKIGFNELVEYHDVAIVELTDGRRFIVSVLTANVGTKSIAELARRVEAIVQ